MNKVMQQLLAETRRLYEAMFRFDASAAAMLGLHVTDLRCVNALEHGPLSAGEIAQRLALTSGSVTALIDRLAAGGFVERLGDPADGRRTLVGLTPRFRREADRVYASLGRAIGDAFGTQERPDPAAATVVIRALAEGFDAAVASSAPAIPARPLRRVRTRNR